MRLDLARLLQCSLQSCGKPHVHLEKGDRHMLASWPPVDPTRIMQGFPRLRETIDELYESGVFPPADVYVREQDVVVEVACSGANPDDFQVAVTPNSVAIAGQVPRELDLGEPQYQGIRRGDFHQSLTLPAPVDPSTAEATYCDGMLRLRMVKAEVTKPHLVQVKHETGTEGETSDTAGKDLQREQIPVGSGRH